ncbi:hypothetical protein ACHAWF_010640 [Thalassiosira exigua]
MRGELRYLLFHRLYLQVREAPGARGPIPKRFTSALRSSVKHVVFASNPCRMRFFSKEIVFFRDDLVGKMRCHCLLEPHEDESDENYGGDNGNEGCLATLSRPSWIRATCCHCRCLHPFPDALIVDDQVDPYYKNYEECSAIKPGPFSNGYIFLAHHTVVHTQKATSTSEVDFCEIG